MYMYITCTLLIGWAQIVETEMKGWTSLEFSSHATVMEG